MNKSKKWKTKKILFIIFSLLILLVLLFLLVKSINNLMPFYKIEERKENIENYKGENEYVKAIAWLRVQGTNIDYPVIDNNDRKANIEDIVKDFTWTQGTTEKLTNKLFILGHNIRNVSSNPLITDKSHARFEQLLSFVYYDFVKDNKYIQYTIDGKDYLYKIFSVSFVQDNTLDYISTDYTKEELKKYIKQSKKDSFFDFNLDVNENDKVISLVTCTRFFGATTSYDFKIDARMVRNNEFINNYKVSKNNNYKQIEEKMRGEEDEQKT